MALAVTKDTFDAEVINSEIPVLIDFWAVWCGPCKIQSQEIEKLEQDEPDLEKSLKIVKINVDDEPDLAAKYGVQSIPTLILIKNGEEAKREVGVQQSAVLKEKFL